jgi:hypothetical protein
MPASRRPPVISSPKVFMIDNFGEVVRIIKGPEDRFI